MKQLAAGLVIALVLAPAWAADPKAADAKAVDTKTANSKAADGKSDNAKKLARFDAGFARCESLNPEMRGHGDEAYLSLWRIPVNAKSRDDLAALRASRVYKTEHAQATARLAKDTSAETTRKLTHQCQATWAETKRANPAAVAAPASAASR